MRATRTGPLGGFLSQADLPRPPSSPGSGWALRLGRCSQTSSGECPLWPFSPNQAEPSLPGSSSRSSGKSVHLEMRNGAKPCPLTLWLLLSHGACGQAGRTLDSPFQQINRGSGQLCSRLFEAPASHPSTNHCYFGTVNEWSRFCPQTALEWIRKLH